jgi:hypothetical protein
MPSRPPSVCAAHPSAGPPAIRDPSPPSAGKRRGNPDLGLAPRCDARTRAGCPRRAPATHGKRRCRMHGGRSTGPRTAEGLARLRAARTVHGRYNAERRAFNRCILSIARRGQVYRAVLDCLDRLPPELAARFEQMQWELVTSLSQAGSITAAQDRALQRAEAEALAPWKAATAVVRQAARALRPETIDDRGAAQATPHAPERPAAGGGAAIPAALPAAPSDPQARPYAPERLAAGGGAAIPAALPSVPANPQPKPHAPERATPTAGLALTGRNLRRWQRKQQQRAARPRP